MLSYEEFKKEYISSVKKDAEESKIQAEYNFYKKNSGDYEEKSEITSIKVKSKFNIQISDTLEKIKVMRELKKVQGPSFNQKEELKELLREIKELREIKKNK